MLVQLDNQPPIGQIVEFDRLEEAILIQPVRRQVRPKSGRDQGACAFVQAWQQRLERRTERRLLLVGEP
ncbi:MAG: hypothetical protein M5U09_29370 [Gammaproteobacteria bacterium]|nr:hypothetical protein [Gammaproteobacteria bacterium]